MTQTHFQTEHAVTIAAPPVAIWSRFADVASWPSWNAGIERITIDGPFATGTRFHMTPPGQDTFTSVLVDVRANEHFIDETRVGDLVVRVAHSLTPERDGATKVTYAITAEGPGADEIGPAICADFPEVLRALAEAVKTKA